jgi:hypothetical protein
MRLIENALVNLFRGTKAEDGILDDMDDIKKDL